MLFRQMFSHSGQLPEVEPACALIRPLFQGAISVFARQLLADGGFCNNEYAAEHVVSVSALRAGRPGVSVPEAGSECICGIYALNRRDSNRLGWEIRQAGLGDE
jgi:hypothetical protein